MHKVQMGTRMRRVRFTNKYVYFELTQGRATVVDLDDWHLVKDYAWHAVFFKRDNHWSASRHTTTVDGKRHRVTLPDALNDDVTVSARHVNRKGLDNRRVNLKYGKRAGPPKTIRDDDDEVVDKFTPSVRGLRKVKPRISRAEYQRMVEAMTDSQFDRLKLTSAPVAIEVNEEESDYPNTVSYLLTTDDDVYVMYYPKSIIFNEEELLDIIRSVYDNRITDEDQV